MDINADNNPDSNADNAATLFHNAAPTVAEDAGNTAGNVAADVATVGGSTPDDDSGQWKTIAETAEELRVNERRVRRRIKADNADNPAYVMQNTRQEMRRTVTGEREGTVLSPSYIERIRADFAPSVNVVAKPDNADNGNDADNASVSELMPRSESVPDSAQLDLIERRLAEIQAFNAGQFLEAMREVQKTNRAQSEMIEAQNERLQAIEAAHKSSEASRSADAKAAREDAAALVERLENTAKTQARIVIENERLQDELAAQKNRKWWQIKK